MLDLELDVKSKIKEPDPCDLFSIQECFEQVGNTFPFYITNGRTDGVSFGPIYKIAEVKHNRFRSPDFLLEFTDSKTWVLV